MGQVKFNFDNHIPGHRSSRACAVAPTWWRCKPQVFDLLVHLLKHRDPRGQPEMISLRWCGEDESSRTRRWDRPHQTPPETRSADKRQGNSGSSAPFPARGFAFVGAVKRGHAMRGAASSVEAGTAGFGVSAARPAQPSPYLLPFDNMSGDREQEYFLRRQSAEEHHHRAVENCAGSS